MLWVVFTSVNLNKANTMTTKGFSLVSICGDAVAAGKLPVWVAGGGSGCSHTRGERTPVFSREALPACREAPRVSRPIQHSVEEPWMSQWRRPPDHTYSPLMPAACGHLPGGEKGAGWDRAESEAEFESQLCHLPTQHLRASVSSSAKWIQQPIPHRAG